MLNRVFLGLSAAVLAVIGFFGAANPPRAEVICCGECKPGDNCLEKCRVIGEVPKDLKLTCCGKCEKGNECVQKCAGGSCCGK